MAELGYSRAFGGFAATRCRGSSLTWLFILFGVCAFWSAADAGSINSFAYQSAALGREQTAQLYVPDGAPPKGGWPVLYLLHGMNGAATDWNRLGRLKTTTDRLIEQGEIKPLVIVMPSGGNSWYVDSADVKGPGNYATAIATDLISAVEAAYPVGHDRAHRSIAGISMGGFGALRLGLSQPDRFSAIGALSPAIWQNIPGAMVDKPLSVLDSARASYFQKADPDTVTTGIDLPPGGDHFGGAFGTPFNPRRFNTSNVFTLLEHAVDGGKNLPSIFLTVGDDDSHLLWRGAIAFFETMQLDGRMIEFRVTDGDHNWECWKTSLGDVLKFVDHAMTEPPA